jgi:hypothetical protein
MYIGGVPFFFKGIIYQKMAKIRLVYYYFRFATPIFYHFSNQSLNNNKKGLRGHRGILYQLRNIVEELNLI